MPEKNGERFIQRDPYNTPQSDWQSTLIGRRARLYAPTQSCRKHTMDWHVRWLEAVAVGCEHHGKVGLVIAATMLDQ